nr:MAG: hypothetical protein DIU68_10980 [Chloroflexota bacterium]
MAEVNARLLSPECRLLTLIGAPGIGKTRLAMQAARAVEPSFPDGVCFVPPLIRLRSHWHPAEVASYDRIVARLRETLGDDEFAHAWAEGRAMTLDEAIAEALGNATTQD